jgi:diguanylate cyclase (GGDEF)-like protein
MEQIRFDEDAPTYFMMIDVNSFKTINDTYGHAEGDKALVFVADALRQACEHIRATVFIGRYGGDEFVIIIQDPEEGEHPEQIVETLRTFLAEKQRENRLPYDLGIGIGYEELRDKNDTPAACLIRADEKLYIDKKKNGMGR